MIPSRDAADAPQPGPPGAPPRRRFLTETFALAAALVGASLLNVLYVLLLGRTLPHASLGVFFCAHSLLLVAAAPGGALQAFTAGRFSGAAPWSDHDFRRGLRALAAAGFAVAAAFGLLAGPLARLLHFDSALPALATGLALAAYAPLPLLYGRLQGSQRFRLLGAIFILEAAVRPLAAGLLFLAGALNATTAVASLAFGYLTASLLALLAGRGAPREDVPPVPGAGAPAGLGATLAALLAVSAFAYLDVLFAQHYFGHPSEGPGSILPEGGVYGAAAYVGRSFLMITLPLVLVLYPKVAAARARGASALAYLRDTAVMAFVVWATGAVACALFPGRITEALFPRQPEAAELVAVFPFAVLPYIALTLLVYFNLARGRGRVAWIPAAGLAGQWAAYGLWHETPGSVLAVLGISGAAIALAAAAYTAWNEGVRGG